MSDYQSATSPAEAGEPRDLLAEPDAPEDRADEDRPTSRAPRGCSVPTSPRPPSLLAIADRRRVESDGIVEPATAGQPDGEPRARTLRRSEVDLTRRPR